MITKEILQWKDYGSTYRLVRVYNRHSGRVSKLHYAVEVMRRDAMGDPKWILQYEVLPGLHWDRSENDTQRSHRLLICALVERDVRRSRRRKRKKS